MKTALSILTIILSASVCSALPTEEIIKQIRADYNRIESASLKSESFKFAPSDDPMEGTLTRYYLNDELVKIRLSYIAGDHGGADETYYYDQGDLFFIYISESSWKFSGTPKANGESETIDTFRERRIYVSGNQPVRYLLKTASSKDPEAGPSVLAKAENQEQTDPVFTSAVINRAVKATNVMGSAEVEGLLFEN